MKSCGSPEHSLKGQERMHTYPEAVVIEEQGLRDGIQNERVILPTGLKLEIIDQLVAAGLTHLQVASFVHPRAVPQMADAAELCAGLKPAAGVAYSTLVLNAKGMERALDAGLRWVEVSLSASDAHSRANVNQSLALARSRMAQMVRRGKDAGLRLRGSVQCAFGCRLQGRVAPDLVLDMVAEQLSLGVDEIKLADSTGMAHPGAVQELCGRVREAAAGKPVWLHLHDTEGKGLVNVLAALQVGVRHFDTSFGGLGGCPFIRGASGNIATEDFAVMLHQMGIATGIDVAQVAAVSRRLEQFLGKSLAGKIHRLARRDDIELFSEPADSP